MLNFLFFKATSSFSANIRRQYFFFFTHQFTDLIFFFFITLIFIFYIFSSCSFFVVEDHVLNTGNGLVTRAYLDEVWENALSKIVASLRTPSVSFMLFEILTIF